MITIETNAKIYHIENKRKAKEIVEKLIKTNTQALVFIGNESFNAASPRSMQYFGIKQK